MYSLVDILMRHWRGEYGLGRTFWLHGFIGWWTIAILFYTFRVGIEPISGTIVKLCLFIIIWVGIWRSANSHPTIWQKRSAKTAVVIGILFIIGNVTRQISQPY